MRQKQTAVGKVLKGMEPKHSVPAVVGAWVQSFCEACMYKKQENCIVYITLVKLRLLQHEDVMKAER